MSKKAKTPEQEQAKLARQEEKRRERIGKIIAWCRVDEFNAHGIYKRAEPLIKKAKKQARSAAMEAARADGKDKATAKTLGDQAADRVSRKTYYLSAAHRMAAERQRSNLEARLRADDHAPSSPARGPVAAGGRGNWRDWGYNG